MTALAPAFTWTSVIGQLCVAEAGASFRIPADSIGHPLDDGLVQFGAASDGSYFDYVHRIDERVWFLARQYADAYDVRIIRLELASTTLVAHGEPVSVLSQNSSSSIADLPTKAPGLTVGIATVLGAIGGACVGGGKGAAVGALIGTSAALAAVAVNNASSSPETAQVAQTMFLGLTSSALGGSSARRASPAPTPPRLASPAASRAESRADRFDRGDFEVRRRRTTKK